MLRKGAIVPTPLDQVRSGYYSSYFVVPQKACGHRPILNLKFFNLNVCKTSSKMETLQSIIAVMHLHQWNGQRGSQGCLLPHSSGRSTPPVPQIQLGTSYQFRILSFDQSSAPRIFTNTVTPLIAWLKLMRVQLYTYLDDPLIVGVTQSI